jgi:hypothetical protein
VTDRVTDSMAFPLFPPVGMGGGGGDVSRPHSYSPRKLSRSVQMNSSVGNCFYPVFKGYVPMKHEIVLSGLKILIIFKATCLHTVLCTLFSNAFSPSA